MFIGMLHMHMTLKRNWKCSDHQRLYKIKSKTWIFFLILPNYLFYPS